MTKLSAALIILILLISAPADAKRTQPRRASRIALDGVQPGSPFDCDTAQASAWFGSTQTLSSPTGPWRASFAC